MDSATPPSTDVLGLLRELAAMAPLGVVQHHAVDFKRLDHLNDQLPGAIWAWARREPFEVRRLGIELSSMEDAYHAKDAGDGLPFFSTTYPGRRPDGMTHEWPAALRAAQAASLASDLDAGIAKPASPGFRRTSL